MSQLRVTLEQTLQEHTNAISKVAFSPNGRLLASSSSDTTLNLYASDSVSPTLHNRTTTLSGHTKGISDFEWTSDSRYICSCSDNQLIIMWDVEIGKPVQLFPRPESLKRVQFSEEPLHSPSNLSMLKSSHFLYDIYVENQIKQQSLRCAQQSMKSMEAKDGHSDSKGNKSSSNAIDDDDNGSAHTHNHYVLCLAVNRQGNIMASGSFDETVILWDVRSAKQIKILSAHSDPVSDLEFCADGSMLLSAGYDGLIRGWDMNSSSRRCIKTLGYDPTAVSFAKWTPNGQYIISGTLDSTIRIWDFQTAKTVKTYRGHSNERYCFQSGDFVVMEGRGVEGQDIQCIVSGSEDGFIYFWDIQSRQIVYKEKAHDDVVITTHFKPNHSKNGPIVFASGALQSDHTVKIWSM